MSAPLGNPFSLGATGVTTTARYDRLALGASFRPGAAALAAVSGFLVGPPGTMGDLTLLTDVLLRVDPFLAVVQGTHNTQQGQYLVPNVQQRDLAVTAKDASLFRRNLIVVRVADSLEAGVASSAATDGAWLEILPGVLAASNPLLPALPANAFAAGELSIPSTASGQPVTLTRYNPRTGSRGGILPVVAADVTPPAFDGQYRDHPVNGLERGQGGVWGHPRPVGPWTELPTTAAWNGTSVTTTGAGFSAPDLQYRIETDCVTMRGWSLSAAAIAAGIALLSAALPAAARPSVGFGLYPRNDIRPNATLHRHEIGPNGQIYPVVAIPNGQYLNWDGVSWPLG